MFKIPSVTPWSLWTLKAKLIAAAILLAIVAFFAYKVYNHVYEAGANSVQVKWDKEKAEAKDAFVERIVIQEKIVTKTEIEYRDRVRTVEVKGETIVQQIPVYVSADDPRLLAGFGVLHDAAVLGVVPTPEFAAEFAGTTYAAADVAETVIRNYTACHVAYERVAAWERYYAELQAVGAGKPPAPQ